MAIAFDATATNKGSGFTGTCTITIVKNKTILWAYVYNNGTTFQVTSVTCSDGNMTEVPAGHQLLSGGGYASLYYFIGPTTLSQAITANLNASSSWGILAASYTGARQFSVPDASIVGTNASSTSYPQALTTVSNNAWTIFACVANTQAPVAGTNTTQRQRDNVTNGTFLGDSNGAVTPAGSFTMTVTTSANANYAGCMASFAPDTGAASGFFLKMV